MSLTILGREPRSHTVWVNVDGDRFPLSRREIADMSREAVDTEAARRGGHDFDLSSIQSIAFASRNGTDLDECAHCGDPAPFESEGAWVCVGHMAGFGRREEEASA